MQCDNFSRPGIDRLYAEQIKLADVCSNSLCSLFSEYAGQANSQPASVSEKAFQGFLGNGTKAAEI